MLKKRSYIDDIDTLDVLFNILTDPHHPHCNDFYQKLNQFLLSLPILFPKSIDLFFFSLLKRYYIEGRETQVLLVFQIWVTQPYAYIDFSLYTYYKLNKNNKIEKTREKKQLSEILIEFIDKEIVEKNELDVAGIWALSNRIKKYLNECIRKFNLSCEEWDLFIDELNQKNILHEHQYHHDIQNNENKDKNNSQIDQNIDNNNHHSDIIHQIDQNIHNHNDIMNNMNLKQPELLNGVSLEGIELESSLSNDKKNENNNNLIKLNNLNLDDNIDNNDNDELVDELEDEFEKNNEAIIEEWTNDISFIIKDRISGRLSDSFIERITEDEKLELRLSNIDNNNNNNNNNERKSNNLNDISQPDFRFSSFDNHNTPLLDDKNEIIPEPPPSTFMNSLRSFDSLLRYNVMEVAQHLTLRERVIAMDRTHPREFIYWSLSSLSKNYYKRKYLPPHLLGSYNLMSWIELVNHRVTWIAHEIFLASYVSGSSYEAIKFFILLADSCIKLNNYSAASQIISALTLPSTRSLEASWAWISSEVMEIFENIKLIVSQDNNYRKYRGKLFNLIKNESPYIQTLHILTKDIFNLTSSIYKIGKNIKKLKLNEIKDEDYLSYNIDLNNIFKLGDILLNYENSKLKPYPICLSLISSKEPIYTDNHFDNDKNKKKIIIINHLNDNNKKDDNKMILTSYFNNNTTLQNPYHLYIPNLIKPKRQSLIIPIKKITEHKKIKRESFVSRLFGHNSDNNNNNNNNNHNNTNENNNNDNNNESIILHLRSELENIIISRESQGDITSEELWEEAKYAKEREARLLMAKLYNAGIL